MRIRSLKPEFWSDKRVGSWPLETRLTYIGLWSAADDFGRGSAEPEKLAAELFPYDLSLNPRDTLARIQGALAVLSQQNRIRLYEGSNGETLFAIQRWAHQRIDRPSKSRFPGPEEADSTSPREKIAAVSGSREQGSGNRERDQVEPAQGDGLAPPTQGTGVLVPTDEQVFAFGEAFPGEPSLGIPPKMATAWLAGWLAWRKDTGKGPFPPVWRDQIGRDYRRDWLSNRHGVRGGPPNGTARFVSVRDLKTQLAELRDKWDCHPANPQCNAYDAELAKDPEIKRLGAELRAEMDQVSEKIRKT